MQCLFFLIGIYVYYDFFKMFEMLSFFVIIVNAAFFEALFFDLSDFILCF